MIVEVEESFEKTRHVKNNDKSKKYIVRGHRNTRYHEKILSNKKKSYNLYVKGMLTYSDFVNFLEDYNRYKVENFSVNQTFNGLSNDISQIVVA